MEDIYEQARSEEVNDMYNHDTEERLSEQYDNPRN